MTKSLFIAEAERTAGFLHVLLITTGSVASIKAPLIVAELLTVRFQLPRWDEFLMLVKSSATE